MPSHHAEIVRPIPRRDNYATRLLDQARALSYIVSRSPSPVTSAVSREKPSSASRSSLYDDIPALEALDLGLLERDTSPFLVTPESRPRSSTQFMPRYRFTEASMEGDTLWKQNTCSALSPSPPGIIFYVDEENRDQNTKATESVEFDDEQENAPPGSAAKRVRWAQPREVDSDADHDVQNPHTESTRTTEPEGEDTTCERSLEIFEDPIEDFE